MMKPWMKALLWLGLGGGIGFFAGYQVGVKGTEKQIESTDDVVLENARNQGFEEGYREGARAIKVYSGFDYDGDHIHYTHDCQGFVGGPVVEEDEMPEDIPVIGDEDEIEEIPELHPQHLIPVQITEDEYYMDPWGYDQEQLYFYEMDEVLYNKETRSAISKKDDMDQIIGIGMTFNFYKSDGEVLDAIFVKNDTMGVLFRIDRLDAAYTDEIAGGNAPEYVDDDEEGDSDE